MLNCATLIGRLTAEPELKTTTSGKEVCAVCIAVDRSGNPAHNPDGKQKTDFIQIVAWGHNAKFVADYFRKGQMIAVVGAIRTRSYEDKKGNRRIAFEVVVKEVSFCGSKPHPSEQSSATFSTEKASEGISYYGNATAADFSDICYDDEDYVEV